MSNNLKLKLIVDADTGKVTGKVLSLKDGLSGVNEESKKVGQTSKDSFNKMLDGGKSVERQIDRLKNQLIAYIGVTQTIGAADEYKSMTGQIALVTESTSQLISVQKELQAIATETRGSITGITKLYSSLSPTFSELGYSMSESTELIELYNKSLALTSPTATESASATLQFAQAMGSGILRGEEFNSIMENGRGVAMMLAEGLGVPIGALRSMAEQGKLTADIVIASLESQADIIEAKFAKIPLTVSQSIQVLKDNLMISIGEFDEFSGATSLIAESIMLLAANINDVAMVIGVSLAAGALAKARLMYLALNTSVVLTTASFVRQQIIAAALVVQMHGLTGAVIVATTAMKALLAAVVAFMRTPWGAVATAAAAGITYLAFSMDDASESSTSFVDHIDETNTGLQQLKQNADGTATALIDLNAEVSDLIGLNLAAEYATQQAAANWLKQTLEDIASLEYEMRKESLQERTDIQAEINKLTQTEQQKRQAILDSLYPENRALQQKLFALKDIAAEEKEWSKWADKELDTIEKQEQALRDAAIAKAELYRQNTIDGQWTMDNAAFDKLDEKDALLDQTLEMANAVDTYGDAWTRTGDKALDAMGSMINAMAAVNSSDQKYAEQMQKLRAAGLEQTEEFIALEDARAKNSIKGSMEMMAAATAMYDEGSQAQQIAHNAYLAMSAIEIASKSKEALVGAVASITNSGTGDPYSAIPRVIAMTALMGGVLSQIGVSLGGAGGGSSPSYQQTQGTGAVDGVAGEKADYMTSALESFVEMEGDQYTELMGIHREMISLNTNITNFGNALYRSLGTLGTGENFNIDTSFKTGFDSMNELAEQSAGVFGLFDTLAGREFNLDFNQVFDNVGDFFAGIDDLANNWDSIGGGTNKIKEEGVQIGTVAFGALLDGIDLSAQTYAKQEIAKWDWLGNKSTKNNWYYADLDESVNSGLSDIMRSASELMIEQAATLNQDIEAELRAIEIEIPRIDLKGLEPEEVSTEVNAVLSTALDGVYDVVFADLLDRFQDFGEESAETIARITQNFGAVSSILNMTNQAFNSDDVLGVSDSLVTVAGSLKDLKTAADGYYDAFFDDEEKHTYLTEQLTSALESQGLSLAANRDGYRDLVESMDMSTEAGRENYYTLIGLHDKASEYYSYIEDAAENVTAVAREALEATAGLVNDAYSALQSSVNAEKTALQDALNDRLAALNDEKTVINDSVSALRQLQSTLESTYKSIINGTDGLDLMTYTSAQAQILQARATGDFTLDGISDALSVVSNNSADNYASRADYLRDQAITANAIGDLSEMTGAQLSTDEQMLASLDAQIDSARALYDTQVAALDAQLSYYDAAINGADDQLSVSESIEQLEQAMLAVLQDIRTATADTYDTLAGGDGLIDWTEFSGAFDGLATESTLRDVFSQLDINGDLYVDAIESVLGTLGGSGFDESHISEYVNSIMSQYDVSTAQQMLTGAAVNSGTTAGQISTATGIDQSTIEQTMYDSWAAIDAQMTALTGGGDVSTGNANAASIYNYAMQMSLTPAQVASYMPDWSADHVRDFIAQNGWQALPEYFVGGHTGNLPIDKIAGVVHGQEYVSPHWQVKQHPDLFAALETERVKGYQSGGPVSFSLPSFNASGNSFERTEKLIEKLIDRIEQLEEQAARTAVATENSSDKLDALENGLPIYDMRVPNA